MRSPWQIRLEPMCARALGNQLVFARFRNIIYGPFFLLFSLLSTERKRNRKGRRTARNFKADMPISTTLTKTHTSHKQTPQDGRPEHQKSIKGNLPTRSLFCFIPVHPHPKKILFYLLLIPLLFFPCIFFIPSTTEHSYAPTPRVYLFSFKTLFFSFFSFLLLFTLYTSVFFPLRRPMVDLYFFSAFMTAGNAKKKQTSQISFHGSALTFSHEFLVHLIPTPSSDRYCKNAEMAIQRAISKRRQASPNSCFFNGSTPAVHSCIIVFFRGG